jgi:hypothetical protein
MTTDEEYKALMAKAAEQAAANRAALKAWLASVKPAGWAPEWNGRTR